MFVILKKKNGFFQRQEALGGESKDSLLNVFRHLAEIRSSESFQHGIFQTGCDRQSNLFWFIREAPGHRGFIVKFSFFSIDKFSLLFSPRFC